MWSKVLSTTYQTLAKSCQKLIKLASTYLCNYYHNPFKVQQSESDQNPIKCFSWCPQRLMKNRTPTVIKILSRSDRKLIKLLSTFYSNYILFTSYQHFIALVSTPYSNFIRTLSKSDPIRLNSDETNQHLTNRLISNWSKAKFDQKIVKIRPS